MKRIIGIISLVLMFLAFGHDLFSQTGYQSFTYPSGQVSSEGLLRDGRPDGMWKTYYESGQLKSVGKRIDFLLDSTWMFFKENGDTSLIVNYKRDLKNGPRFTYSETEIVMEPFVVPSGGVGRDIRIWREMFSDVSEKALDNEAAESVKYLREAFL